MDFEIRNEDGSEIIIVPDLPEDIKRLNKLAAGCYTLLGDWGKATFVYYKGNGFTIAFNEYNVEVNTILRARSNVSILEMNISLGHPIIGTWEGISQPTLFRHQFSLSYTPYVNTRAQFLPGKSYGSYDIHFEKFFLQELAADFRVLSEFMEQVEKERSAGLSPHNYHCTPDMLAAIRFIENNQYSVNAQRYLVEYKVKEILISALETVADVLREREIKLTAGDEEALRDLRTFIELNLDEMPSLKHLCRKSGLNEDKLKRGFRKLFGTTPYDYHIQLKMEEAKRLLLDTDKLVYEIAYMVGYHHVSNFCIEFKKLFGCQPGYFRKYGKKK